MSTIKQKSWDLDKQKIRFQRVEVIRRSYGTADKVEKGMAYKIRLER